MTEPPDDTIPNAPLDRRTFVERVAGIAALTSVARPGRTLQAPATPPAGSFNGIQMGPHTILDEGIERTLDLIAETAAINAVMPYSHAYNAALVKPLRDRADHGVPLTDNAGRQFPLVWVRTHAEYYKDTTLRHQVVTGNHEHAGRDLFAELVQPARARGMKVYARILESSAFTADYVFRETKRSVASANGKTKIYAGVGFDVPGSPRDDPETIYEASTKALAAAAHGIVVSREYEEMKLEHLRAVGRAVRQAVPPAARPPAK